MPSQQVRGSALGGRGLFSGCSVSAFGSVITPYICYFNVILGSLYILLANISIILGYNFYIKLSLFKLLCGFSLLFGSRQTLLFFKYAVCLFIVIVTCQKFLSLSFISVNITGIVILQFVSSNCSPGVSVSLFLVSVVYADSHLFASSPPVVGYI